MKRIKLNIKFSEQHLKFGQKQFEKIERRQNTLRKSKEQNERLGIAKEHESTQRVPTEEHRQNDEFARLT